jgi:hypothetical protein
MPNFQWAGYVGDAYALAEPDAGAPLTPYSLDDARKSGKRYAMVNIAEFLCPGCNQSAIEIGASGAAVAQAGGVVIEVLMTKGLYQIASEGDLHSWVTQSNHTLHVTAMKDPDGSSGTPTSTALGRRDQVFIIDLTTMKVVQAITGAVFANPGMNSGGLGLAAMHTLLGK